MRSLATAVALVVVAAASAQSDVRPARPVDLLSQASVRLDGAFPDDRAGASVAMGDVNGDGRPDLVVGAEGADQNGRLNSGSVCVVFGPSTGTVDLGVGGDRGFRIDGAAVGDRAGSVVAVADVNADGRVDVVVGAELADGSGRNEAGSVYVVHGKSTTETVDLAVLGTAGFRIDGASAGDRAGGALATAGDVNGDSRQDLVIGAARADGAGLPDSGSAYVVFGTASTQTIDLAAPGAAGFRIAGAAAGDRIGISVAGVGDLNADGRADLVLGADGAEHGGGRSSGSAYVVFGRATIETVDLAALGGGGFRVDGPPGALVGSSVAGAGDVNADRLPDLVVGGSAADLFSGEAYVVFGKATTATVDLTALGAGGIRIEGGAAGDRAGAAVAGAGDVDGDGRADVVVAADGADHRQRRDAGSVYLVYGKASTESVDLASLGANGFALDGAAAGDNAGLSVAVSGMGPGRADVVVGAPRADNNMRIDAGSAYVVALDGRAPTLRLGGPGSQRVGARQRLIVVASCDEACALTARGRIAVAGRRTGVRLSPASARLARAGSRTLPLRIADAQLRRLRSALGSAVRARATITVRAADAAGNVRTATRTVVVRR